MIEAKMPAVWENLREKCQSPWWRPCEWTFDPAFTDAPAEGHWGVIMAIMWLSR